VHVMLVTCIESAANSFFFFFFGRIIWRLKLRLNTKLHVASGAETHMYIRLIVHDLLLFLCSLVHRLIRKRNVISCVWAICLRVNAEISYGILTRTLGTMSTSGGSDVFILRMVTNVSEEPYTSISE
jgi:hypothetical protein